MRKDLFVQLATQLHRLISCQSHVRVCSTCDSMSATDFVSWVLWRWPHLEAMQRVVGRWFRQRVSPQHKVSYLTILNPMIETKMKHRSLQHCYFSSRADIASLEIWAHTPKSISWHTYGILWRPQLGRVMASQFEADLPHDPPTKQPLSRRRPQESLPIRLMEGRRPSRVCRFLPWKSFWNIVDDSLARFQMIFPPPYLWQKARRSLKSSKLPWPKRPLPKRPVMWKSGSADISRVTNTPLYCIYLLWDTFKFPSLDKLWISLNHQKGMQKKDHIISYSCNVPYSLLCWKLL